MPDQHAGLGCHIDNNFVGCMRRLRWWRELCYAQATASVVQLNKMLEICLFQGEMLDVRFNPKK